MLKTTETTGRNNLSPVARNLRVTSDGKRATDLREVKKMSISDHYWSDVNADYKYLLPDECRTEMESGDGDPMAVISSECVPEVRALDKHPDILEEAKKAIAGCTPGAMESPEGALQRCLNSLRRDKRNLLNKEVARDEIAGVCSGRYGTGGSSEADCLSLRDIYLDSGEVNFEEESGRKVASRFDESLEKIHDEAFSILKRVDRPGIRELAQQKEKLALSSARNVYRLVRGSEAGVVRVGTGGEQTDVTNFEESVDSVVGQMASVSRDTAQMDVTFEKPEPVVEKPVEKPVEKIEERKIPVEPRKIAVSEAEKKRLEMRSAAISELRNKCEGRLAGYIEQDHPLIVALKIVLPPIAWSHLQKYVMTKFDEIMQFIPDKNLMNSEGQLIAKTSEVLGETIWAASIYSINKLADTIARMAYSETGYDYGKLRVLGLLGGGKFMYGDSTERVKFDRLPDEVKPLAAIMQSIREWKDIRSLYAGECAGILEDAYGWLENRNAISALPPERALEKGTELGLGNVNAGFETLEGYYKEPGHILE